MRGKSVNDALMSSDFRPSGFDHLRTLLSVSIIVFHSFQYSYGIAFMNQAWDGPFRPLMKLSVPMFFCLSGFLVAGSMERSKTLVNFLGLRIIRIYPALAVEVLISAFIIGPLVTSAPLRQYFTSHLFFRYLLNVTGRISYELPGVFTFNPYPVLVNSQLWTVPYELMCYIALSIIILLGVKKHNFIIIFSILAFVVVAVVTKIYLNGNFHTELNARGHHIVLCFLVGVAFYVYKKYIPYNPYLFVASVVMSGILFGYVDGGEYLGSIAVTYLTVYLGLLNPRRNIITIGANYSYGMYLYGSVILQCIIYFLPHYRQWYIVLAIALPASLLVAMVSWHVVEKPALRSKSVIKYLETMWIPFKAGWLRSAEAAAGN